MGPAAPFALVDGRFEGTLIVVGIFKPPASVLFLSSGFSNPVFSCPKRPYTNVT